MTSRVDWRAVSCFYVLACALSWPFLWWYFHGWESWKAPIFLKISTFMWGPGLSALACLAAFRRSHARTIRFTGTSLGRSVAFYGVPCALLVLVHAPDRGGQVAATAAFLGLFGLFNVVGEELGWRGFLQDALRPLPRWGRYALIGVLWEIWHFRFAASLSGGVGLGRVIATEVGLCGVLAVLSGIIGEATDRTRSLLVASALHFWVDAVIEAPRFLGVKPHRTYVVAALSVAFWGWLLRTWPRGKGSGANGTRKSATPIQC